MSKLFHDLNAQIIEQINRYLLNQFKILLENLVEFEVGNYDCWYTNMVVRSTKLSIQTRNIEQVLEQNVEFLCNPLSIRFDRTPHGFYNLTYENQTWVNMELKSSIFTHTYLLICQNKYIRYSVSNIEIYTCQDRPFFSFLFKFIVAWHLLSSFLTSPSIFKSYSTLL